MRLVTFALFLVAATSVSAAPAPPESWGKVGVGYEQYRLDALECSSAGYDLDISKTEDAKAFVSASRRLETEIGSGVDPYTYQAIVHSVRPGARYRSIKQLQQSTVDQCLVSRGYSKFRLTDQQQSGLRKLKAGSVERHMYLYKLGSEPNVLTSQSVATDASSRGRQRPSRGAPDLIREDSVRLLTIPPCEHSSWGGEPCTAWWRGLPVPAGAGMASSPFSYALGCVFLAIRIDYLSLLSRQLHVMAIYVREGTRWRAARYQETPID